VAGEARTLSLARLRLANADGRAPVPPVKALGAGIRWRRFHAAPGVSLAPNCEGLATLSRSVWFSANEKAADDTGPGGPPEHVGNPTAPNKAATGVVASMLET